MIIKTLFHKNKFHKLIQVVNQFNLILFYSYMNMNEHFAQGIKVNKHETLTGIISINLEVIIWEWEGCAEFDNACLYTCVFTEENNTRHVNIPKRQYM